MPEYQQQVQFQMPSPSKLFTPAVTVILIIMVISLMLSAVSGFPIDELFGLSRQGMRRGMLWQLITYTLVNADPMQMVFSGLAVLFLGSMIERQWKTISFVFLWFVVSVVCGFAWMLLDVVMGAGNIAVGANPCVYGMLGTFGILFRGRRFFMFFATIETKYLILILLAIGVLLAISQPITLVWILGAPVGYGYTKLMWNLRSKMAASSNVKARSSRFADLD